MAGVMLALNYWILYEEWELKEKEIANTRRCDFVNCDFIQELGNTPYRIHALATAFVTPSLSYQLSAIPFTVTGPKQ